MTDLTELHHVLSRIETATGIEQQDYIPDGIQRLSSIVQRLETQFPSEDSNGAPLSSGDVVLETTQQERATTSNSTPEEVTAVSEGVKALLSKTKEASTESVSNTPSSNKGCCSIS